MGRRDEPESQPDSRGTLAAVATTRRTTRPRPGGVSVEEVRQLLLSLPAVLEGSSYGLPAFLLNGRFLARFRDDDTVLVLELAEIGDRDVLMQLDPRAFFFTDHYRDYPAVLVRLAEVPRSLLTDVVRESHRHLAARPSRSRAGPRSRGHRKKAAPRRR